MVYTSTQSLNVEEFLVRYGDNPRYELVDGELIDMEPTGPHELVSLLILARYIQIVAQRLREKITTSSARSVKFALH
ncbi:MAG: Uma2 family endonuclease [Cyanobacteria bacterium]|nr:Uma2 family endonuclease [Cyanobacteriota bacterium]